MTRINTILSDIYGYDVTDYEVIVGGDNMEVKIHYGDSVVYLKRLVGSEFKNFKSIYNRIDELDDDDIRKKLLMETLHNGSNNAVNNGVFVYHRIGGPASETPDQIQYFINGRHHRDDGPAMIIFDVMYWFLNDEQFTIEEYLTKVGKYIENNYNKQFNICYYLNKCDDKDKATKFVLSNDDESHNVPSLIKQFLLKDKNIKSREDFNIEQKEKVNKLIDAYEEGFLKYKKANQDSDDFKKNNGVRDFDYDNPKFKEWVKVNDVAFKLEMDLSRLHHEVYLYARDNVLSDDDPRKNDNYDSIFTSKHRHSFDTFADHARKVVANMPELNINYRLLMLNKIRNGFPEHKVGNTVRKIIEIVGDDTSDFDRKWLDVCNEICSLASSKSKDLLLDLHSISFKGKNLDDKSFNVLKSLV